jgi:hypothetical protein
MALKVVYLAGGVLPNRHLARTTKSPWILAEQWLGPGSNRQTLARPDNAQLAGKTRLTAGMEGLNSSDTNGL